MNRLRITRRESLLAMGTAALSPALTALAADRKRLFQIAACDWSIGKSGTAEALEVAAQLGLDGVQVSFGPPGEKYDLRKEVVRQTYLEASKKQGVAIASLAMGVLNRVPYSSDAKAEQWVAECVEVMPKLEQKVVLLAFFGRGDIDGKPELKEEVVRRLKRIVPAAEKANLVLGIESWMNADDHLRILDAVGSPAVQVYYDVANMGGRGYDIYEEIAQLGRERICEIHCKENGFLLGQGRTDFVKLKQTLEKIDWSGWLVIEGAVGKGMKMFDSYQRNQKYLRSVFPTAE